MKAASFDYHAPPTVESAVALLERFESEGLDAKVLAGGQSLMPMLNMRIARPQVLIDLGRIGALPAHVLLETYSWLTGMRGHSVSPKTVLSSFDALNIAVVQLPPGQYLRLLARFAGSGRSGAAIYDAQIAATAKHHGLTLLSRDRRAAKVYDLVGVDYELI